MSTYHASSLYQTFPPEEAQRLVQKLEIHDIPMHGAWLKTADVELSVLAKQYLADSVTSIDTLKEDVQLWTEQLNNRKLL